MSVSHLEPFGFGVHEELNNECCNGCTQPNGDKEEEPTSVFECDNLFFPVFYMGLLNVMPFVTLGSILQSLLIQARYKSHLTCQVK